MSSGGSITGYCIWDRQDALHLLELIASTDDAQRGLLGFLARQPDALIEWSASPTLLTEFGLPGQGLPPEPGVMLRIVDLEAALSALHSAHYAPMLAKHDTSLTLHAADSLCPQNTRPLRLTADGIVPGAVSDSEWLRADIRVVGPSLLRGLVLPSEAAAENLLVASSPQTLRLAGHLFPLRAPYVAPLDQF